MLFNMNMHNHALFLQINTDYIVTVNLGPYLVISIDLFTLGMLTKQIFIYSF